MERYEIDFLAAAKAYRELCVAMSTYFADAPHSETSKQEALEFRGTLRGLDSMLTEIADFLANNGDPAEVELLRDTLSWLPEQINFFNEDNIEAARR